MDKTSVWRISRFLERMDLLDQQYRLLSRASVLRRQQFGIHNSEIRAPCRKQLICRSGLDLRARNSPGAEPGGPEHRQMASQRQWIAGDLASGDDPCHDGADRLDEVRVGDAFHSGEPDSQASLNRRPRPLVYASIWL